MSSVLTTNTRAFCVTQAQVYPDTLDLMQTILALPYPGRTVGCRLKDIL